MYLDTSFFSQQMPYCLLINSPSIYGSGFMQHHTSQLDFEKKEIDTFFLFFYDFFCRRISCRDKDNATDK